jgi:arabinose-5-phosphate isomerase
VRAANHGPPSQEIELIREAAGKLLEVEAEAVRSLVDRLGPEFDRAVEMLASCRGRVVVTGMGKSGIVARKIAATLTSTGTPALFLHPAEALHGDLGMLVEGDVVLALSNSGETEELLRLLETIRRLGAYLVALSGRPGSTLAQAADAALDTSVPDEGCPIGLVPMASTTTALAMGDALSTALMIRKGFSEEDFARFHPGGRLGRHLLKVEAVMHTGAELPRVTPQTLMREAIVEMTRRKLGCTTVATEDGRLVGIITDGDLRRLLEREDQPLDRCAGEVMTPEPVTIRPGELASRALKMMEDRKITMLPVTTEELVLRGLVQIHDLWRIQLF